MITKTISGVLFLFPDNSNRDLVFCFAMFLFFSSAGKGSLSIKLSVGLGHYGGVIGKEMT